MTHFKNCKPIKLQLESATLVEFFKQIGTNIFCTNSAQKVVLSQSKWLPQTYRFPSLVSIEDNRYSIADYLTIESFLTNKRGIFVFALRTNSTVCDNNDHDNFSLLVLISKVHHNSKKS